MKERRTYAIVFSLLVLLVVVTFKWERGYRSDKAVLAVGIEQETVINQHSARMHLLDADIIMGPSAGIIGEKTDIYRSYEWLKEKGHDSLLLELAIAKNPYTRSYAFLALCRRKHPMVKELLEKNLSDTTELKTLDGCLGGSCSLNVLWLAGINNAVSDSVYRKLAKKMFKGSNQLPICISSIVQR